MKINIITKNDNNAIGREEYIADLHFDKATPTRAEIKSAIISAIGKDPELTIIKKIEQRAGLRAIRVTFYVYADKEVLKRVEPVYIQKREGFLNDAKQSNQQSSS
ncbi:MAG: hypothetical protein QXS91_03170 [Candidatus Anstonellales archaeon]